MTRRSQSTVGCEASSANRRAFTLIETLTALTMGMMLIGVAWSAFSQARQAIRRAQIRLELHDRARVVYENLRQDLGVMQHSCAAWLLHKPDGLGDPRTEARGPRLEQVFMVTSQDPVEYDARAQDNPGAFYHHGPDLRWCMWRYDATAGVVASARLPLNRIVMLGAWRSDIPWNTAPAAGLPSPASTQRSDITWSRWAQNRGTADSLVEGKKLLDASGTLSLGSGGDSSWAVYWSQPRRWTPGDDVTRLDDNRWCYPAVNVIPAAAGTSIFKDNLQQYAPAQYVPRNVGDYTALQQALTPVVGNVVDFQVQWVLADGAVIAAGGGLGTGESVDFCARGVRVDGMTEAEEKTSGFRAGLAPKVAATGPHGASVPDRSTPSPRYVSSNNTAAADERSLRPVLVRVAFTLVDPALDIRDAQSMAEPTAVRESFSFSFPTPGVAHAP